MSIIIRRCIGVSDTGAPLGNGPQCWCLFGPLNPQNPVFFHTPAAWPQTHGRAQTSVHPSCSEQWGAQHNLDSQWLIIMIDFKPIMVYFGVEWPIISSYLAVQGVFKRGFGRTPETGKRSRSANREISDIQKGCGRIRHVGNHCMSANIVYICMHKYTVNLTSIKQTQQMCGTSFFPYAWRELLLVKLACKIQVMELHVHQACCETAIRQEELQYSQYCL